MSGGNGKAEGHPSAHPPPFVANGLPLRLPDDRDGKPDAGPQASIFDVRQEAVWEDHLAANRDLAERLRQALSRAGIGRRDPLAPVIALLGEMLQRYTHLAADQIGAMREVVANEAAARSRALDTVAGLLDAAVGTVRLQAHTANATVRESATTAVDTVDRAVGRAIADQHAVARQFEGTLRGILHDALRQNARLVRRRTWRDAALGLAGMVLLVAAIAAGAFWQGAVWKEHTLAATLKVGNEILGDVLHRDGADTVLRWLDLMQANRLSDSRHDCSMQATPGGSRQACAYLFWDEPIIPDAPPKSR